jgi:hypothetical protein
MREDWFRYRVTMLSSSAIGSREQTSFPPGARGPRPRSLLAR